MLLHIRMPAIRSDCFGKALLPAKHLSPTKTGNRAQRAGGRIVGTNGEGYTVHALLGNICEGMEVFRKEAPGRHAGAHPAVALLLLRMHPQHIPPLPRRVKLHPHYTISVLLPTQISSHAHPTPTRGNQH